MMNYHLGIFKLTFCSLLMHIGPAGRGRGRGGPVRGRGRGRGRR